MFRVPHKYFQSDDLQKTCPGQPVHLRQAVGWINAVHYKSVSCPVKSSLPPVICSAAFTSFRRVLQLVAVQLPNQTVLQPLTCCQQCRGWALTYGKKAWLFCFIPKMFSGVQGLLLQPWQIMSSWSLHYVQGDCHCWNRFGLFNSSEGKL